MIQIKLFLILKKHLHVSLITKTIFVVAYLMVLVEKNNWCLYEYIWKNGKCYAKNPYIVSYYIIKYNYN